MNSKLTLGMAILAATALGGCASATSPLDKTPSSSISAGQVGVLALGTGAGALAGNAIGGTKGAVIGGAVGLAGTAIGMNAVASHQQQAVAEAEAAGERKGRTEVFEAMWDQQTRSPTANVAGAASPAQAQITYPAQTVEGVSYAPRVTSSPGLTEPSR